MCGKKEEDDQVGECSQSIHHNLHAYQEQLFLQQQLQHQQQQQFSTNHDAYGGGGGGGGRGGGGGAGLVFPADISPILPWSFPQVHHNFNPVQFSTINQVRSDHDINLFNLVPPPPPMTAQEIMDAKALAASKSHSEAERRRRERINNHLAKLRSLLPSTTKTDKASLLAEVIQHVKELKRQTSQIAEASPVPTENDELTVDNASDEDGKFIIKASLCCEDRSDLLPDLIKTLKALRLRTLKAEITTLGGRVKNVLFITGDDNDDDQDQSKTNNNNSDQQQQHSLTSIQEALKAVMERTTGDESSSGSIKRQRTNMNMLEHRSL
ncbi:Myc-type [Macleaya cordata]|uniref:Myc-type n=1 Tax=Macleaya cordata TaxID=56857 RepID=A0A200Q8J9_MACCD|nr:Myc-type [Macleaya cordata]